MDGAMGQEEDVVEAVLTCEGDFHDPELFKRIEKFRHGLKDLLFTEKHKLQVKKVEPWNSVKVTLTIPRDAASRLRQLAHSGNDSLRQMGVLSVQIQGDSQISLTLAGRNNEPTEFVLRAPALSTTAMGSDADFTVSTDHASSPGPSNDEVTRKNIVDYLRQGSAIRQNASLFESILGGVGTSSPALGLGLGISQHSSTFQNPSLNSSTFRHSTISCIAAQSPGLRGSPLRNSFPFSKSSTGAFHPPVPRLPASAGQSSVTKPIQPGNRPVGQNVTLSQVVHINSNSHAALHSSISNFNPAGPLRLPASLSPNFHSQNALLPPPLSSSPTSAMMMDLPPPPPYPHNNNSRPGKPVTASSPLLVNLLQTDPLMVAAGMASGNPNKPLSLGDLEGPPSKKKKRSKKSKDGLAKPFSLTESLAHSNPAFSHGLSNSGIDLNRLSRVTEDTYSIHLQTPFTFKDSSTDVVQPRTGAMLASHIPDSLIPNFRPDSKPSFLPDRPFIQSHRDTLSVSKFQLETSRSAIGVSNVSSKHSDSMVRENLPKDSDPFNLEMSAGKIVNPYTGQLEPRDSVDIGLMGDNFATQILAKKAKEMDELNKMSVPISSSHALDVHVGTVSPTPVTLSNSTAGFIRSGGPFQVCSDRINSVSPHHRNYIGDGSVKDLKQSAPSNIYALPSRQDIAGSLMPDSSPLTQSLPNTSHTAVNKSSPVQRTVGSTTVPMNGPVLSSHSFSPSHFEFIETSVPSGVSFTQSGSVIYSDTAVSLPVTRVSLSQPPVQQAMSVPPIIEAARVRPTSSVTPHHSKPISSPSNAPDRIPLLPNTHNQAASSDTVGNSLGTKFSSPHLLNSFPEKHIDSLSGTESPPEKVLSEGDDNSNHSGVATDSLPDNSGAAALIEHSGVKAENHDSGLGSSSERSDDTPSEPGDNEFRPSNAVGENEETVSKTHLTKQSVASCKLDTKQLNSITVGYMVNPSETANQCKLIPSKYSSHLDMKATCAPNRTVSMSQLMDAQGKANEKQNGQQPLLSASWPLESKLHYQSSCSGLLKDSSGDLVTVSSQNGPSLSSSLDKMLTAVNESQLKKMRSSPKQTIKKDTPSDHMKLQAEVLEKISKLHQFAESAKMNSDPAAKNSTIDKEDASDSLSRPVHLEDKVEHLIFDMEELVNGKTLGNGGIGLEGKGGSNITSIYSKRSSPVNVNMLNHIYAPGLPLPRRLTESVQRLVKPLPASESSANVPNARACKSPASGNSSRSLSSTNGSSNRVSFQSGTRSPGASMPKLVPNDKYSLLSGGLDLAGLSTLQYGSNSGVDSIHSSKLAVPVLTADLSLKDNNSLPSPLSPPKLIFDGKSLGNKLLSQSYPPLKYRENSPHLAQEITDQSSSVQSSHLSVSKFEIPNLSQELKHFISSKSLEQNVPQTNRVFLETGSNFFTSKVAMQTRATNDNSHSSHDSNSVDISIDNCSHSSTASLMQQGQDLAVPSISSHLPFLSTSSEISLSGSSSGTMTAPTTSSTLCVPYTTASAQGNSPVTLKVSLCGSPGPLPTLYPIPVSTVGTKAETSLASSTSSKATGADSPTPPKLTKVSLPCNPPPLFPRTGSHFSRNLFESVTSTLTTEDMQCDLNSSESMSSTISTETASEWLSRTIQKKSTELEKSISLFSPPKHSEEGTPASGLTEGHKSEFRQLEILSKTVNLSNNRVNIANVLEDKIDTPTSIVQDSVRNTETHKALTPEVESQDSVPPADQNSTSILTHPDSESLNCVDIVAETIASVAAGVEGSVNQPQPHLPTVSHVKEPILETIASSLGATLSTDLSKPLTASATLTTDVSKPLTVSATLTTDVSKPLTASVTLTTAAHVTLDNAEEIKSVENRSSSESPTVLNNVEGCIQTSNTDSGKPVDNVKLDSISGESETTADTSSVVESSTKRVTRKRKSTHSEGDSRDGESEVSSSETTSSKLAGTISSQPSHKQNVKSVSLTNSKLLDPGASKPFKDVSTLKTYSKAVNLGNGEFHNKTLKAAPSVTSEEKDTARQSRPHRASLSEEKDTHSVQEGKHSSSADDKEITNKDLSSASVLNSDIKLYGSADDKETSQATCSDLKESLHKENSSLDGEDQGEVCPKLTASLDELVKNSNKDSMIMMDKSAIQGNDEGHKKTHRIRRQFYAYVPEKSIDQTYFDTPILSGRTRSKNKPADQESQDGTTVNESNHVEVSQLTPSGKGDTNLEGGSAKRPTRSVRAKDNPQDQSLNKRRKVQQHR